MNRPPEPSYTAPTPNRKETRRRQADLYDYNMETEGARIHVEVWLHEEITPPQSAEIFLAMEELRRAVAWRKEKRPNAPSAASTSAAPTSAGVRPRAGVTMYVTRQKIKIAQVYPADAA